MPRNGDGERLVVWRKFIRLRKEVAIAGEDDTGDPDVAAVGATQHGTPIERRARAKGCALPPDLKVMRAVREPYLLANHVLAGEYHNAGRLQEPGRQNECAADQLLGVAQTILDGMPLDFRAATSGLLRNLTVSAPAGAVIGAIGDHASGLNDLLSLADAQGAVVYGPADIADLDAFDRARLGAKLHDDRRQGRTVLLSTHEGDLLAELTDELWWFRDGALAAKGHPDEILPKYRRWVMEKLRSDADGKPSVLAPSMRRGDGRASLVSLETLGANATPASVWRSGEEVAVRVVVRFAQTVADPVIGILIRTRIGMEVYGTNTGLEKVAVGPCVPGDERTIVFRFRCDLCPKEYTLTAASHDPDGVWHDWMEDAVAFTVADDRYTAGVANLRCRVEVISNRG